MKKLVCPRPPRQLVFFYSLHGLTVFVGSFVASLAVTWGSGAAIFADEDADSVASMRQAFSEIAARYQIRGERRDGEPFKLESRPVLNWTNPRRQTDAGAMFLWTSSGRPQVAMCIYPSAKGFFDYEFQSLATHVVSADTGGAVVWEPSSAGIVFQRLPDTAEPGATAPVRLRQMRSIARRFSVLIKPPGKGELPVRLMPAPVYRSPPDANAGILDGALFTFVLGTDPEALLRVEAVDDEQGRHWRFGFARMSVVPIDARLDGELVWQATKTSPARFKPYFVIRRVERDDAEIIVFE